MWFSITDSRRERKPESPGEIASPDPPGPNLRFSAPR